VVVIVVSILMFTSKANSPKSVPVNQLGPEFYENLPEDVIKLRDDFEKETLTYEEMMKPYNTKLDEKKLSAKKAEDLLPEVDLKTGIQEMKVNDLWRDYNARFNQLKKECRAKKRASKSR